MQKIFLPSPFSAKPQRSPLLLVALVISALIAAQVLEAQNSQFYFDPSGNLTAQTAESPAPPQILGQPQMQIVIPGGSASFSVVVADARGATYQWQFNGAAISGATADTLLLTNVTADDEGLYSVIVYNGSGQLISSQANLYIDSDGDGLPDSWEIAHFGSLGEGADGDADGDGVSNFQEFLDGTDPTNAASALYRITLYNDAGTVQISPDQTAFTNGQVVTLTAIGSDATPFHAWTGDIASRANPLTFTITTNLALFARFLPFSLRWTNAASGDWNAPANWSPNLIPSTNENVVMANGTTVTENSNVDLLDFTLTSGTLTGSGRVNISGAGVWPSGNMSGSGATVVLPSATLTINNPSQVELEGGRTLDNAGTVNWSGATLDMNSGYITNEPGALFQLQNPQTFYNGGGGARFDNAGTLRIPGGGTTTFSVVQLNNYNLVDFQGGMLTLTGGGINAGIIPVPAGAVINFAGGVFNSAANSSIAGAGTLVVSSAGTHTFAGTVSPTNLVISGNNAPIMNFNGPGMVTPQNLTLSGGTLGGAQNVTVGSAMTWTGGTMSGTGRTIIPAGATLTINNPGGVELYERTLDNAGTVNWSGSSSITINGGYITNEPGALFQLQNPQALDNGGLGARFDNAGTLQIPGGGTTTFYYVALNNYNVVDLQDGTLTLTGGGTNAGVIPVPAGAVINLGGGSFNSGAGSSITGAGTLVISSSGTTHTFEGTVSLTNLVISNSPVANFNGPGAVTPQNLTLGGGTLEGAQNVTVGSAMSWTGGTMSGAGKTIIPAGATLTINNPGGVELYGGRILDNAGTVNWSGSSSITLNGGYITNEPGALFQLQNPQALDNGGLGARFDNAGTLRIPGGGTTTFYYVPLNNYKLVDLQTGALSVNGGFNSSSNAALNCALAGTAPGTNYGQLRISGSVTLAGTVTVSLTDGYVPAMNDSFTLVSASTRNGMFSSFLYPEDQVGMLVSNTATAVIAIVTNVLVSSGQTLPVLRLETISENAVRIYWSTNFPDFRLQFNNSLTATNWAVTGLRPAITGTNFVVTNLLTDAQQFFRLSNR